MDGERQRDRPRGVGVDPGPLVGGPLRRGDAADRRRIRSIRWREMDFQMIWCPVLMADPDGTRWGLFMHLVDIDRLRAPPSHRHGRGGASRRAGRADGRHPPRPVLRPGQSAVAGRPGGVTMEDGADAAFRLEVPTATGFHLGAGLYFGWQGHHHGEWRGELHVDGERSRTAGCRGGPPAAPAPRHLRPRPRPRHRCRRLGATASPYRRRLPRQGLPADSSFW